MSNLKSGDKVVCIKPGDPKNGLIKGKIYTVFNCFTSKLGESVIEVLESMPPEPYHGYLSWRFRKAVDSDLPKIKNELEMV